MGEKIGDIVSRRIDKIVRIDKITGGGGVGLGDVRPTKIDKIDRIDKIAGGEGAGMAGSWAAQN